MSKLTDYAREGFRKRRRPWDRTELPEWWNLAVWAGCACVAVMLAVSAVLARGESSDAAASGSAVPDYPVQTLNPGDLGASPGSGGPTPTAPASTAPTLPAGVSPTDFTASAAMRVPMTGGGKAVVPAGAWNMARAAARAAATGDWSGIPFIGAARPAPAKPTPRGSVVGGVTVADPAVTGNSQYRFSAKITHGGRTEPYVVELLVEPNQPGFAIRAR